MSAYVSTDAVGEYTATMLLRFACAWLSCFGLALSLPGRLRLADKRQHLLQDIVRALKPRRWNIIYIRSMYLCCDRSRGTQTRY